ncbi:MULTISPECIES: hypothetical protein [Pseudomonas]|uniref:Uncharacterized protein n=1 Tax=Pseudomonas pudica TaxID=272772 RepID=A0ABS0G1T7_9PSED|nr:MULTISPECIES: hypothetical protein [Pseudomonas]MBF8646514.1 hypothetical protein [Pseudomonas pudica]MBF8761898.1 hypothetical protein [Pseudomonas pudica]HDS0973475.1 hypothetical protein [Pseudomonas putida]
MFVLTTDTEPDQCLLLPGDLAQKQHCQEGSYISGSRYGVTGGKPIL